ncbi:large conductance mechanosensitive channel protein MscL [Aureimonas fodinaquatilis]|uniref:Large-conductance mechanosensitive channel n=1 Tax=Aureimonas fodinaquatilis TaxID=2565783 RepID=A0A5B0DYS7_9HYPH|nr:large conductance mechanosensitive channel protein MscL [Aureimonas fodinaquatilis]KAA0970921.1 large conductance mechanosensitive channel protein MscL [Aureimonas fodinaquatilis]
MLKEFREFALKGNMVDLAIGIIIGAAFSGLVNSVVADIIMPIIGVMTGGGVDFSNLFIPLSSNVTAAGLTLAREQGPVLAYGNFLTLFINFMIVAFVLFMVVKAMNRLKRQEEAKPVEVAEVPREEKLLEEIRDILAVSNSPRPGSGPGRIPGTEF